MPRALCLLREDVPNRRQCFIQGLTAAGFAVHPEIPFPEPGDVVVIWNRGKHQDPVARRFEAAGAKAWVVENGYLGKRWGAGGWYALAEGHHAGAGRWPHGGPERWDALDAKLRPWRTGGDEVIILGQRGIGEPGIASPKEWAERTKARLGVGRIRQHPGKYTGGVTLEQDLERARCVVTWASGAALTALLLGIPVFYEFPLWIGREAGLPLDQWGDEPKRDDGARLAAFRRVAWAMWRVEEIVSGEAFRWLGR